MSDGEPIGADPGRKPDSLCQNFEPALKELHKTVSAAFDPATDQAGAMPLTETTRYAMAVMAVVRFLDQSGADRRDANKLADLVMALLELQFGVQADFLKPAKVENRRREPSAKWRARARLCHALEFLRRSGMTIEQAAKHIEHRHSRFKLLASGKGGLAAAIVGWHHKFERGQVKDLVAQEAYRHNKATLDKVLDSVKPPCLSTRSKRWRKAADLFLEDAGGGRLI